MLSKPRLVLVNLEKQTMEIAISIIEAAKRAGVGRSSIYQAIGRGEL